MVPVIRFSYDELHVDHGCLGYQNRDELKTTRPLRKSEVWRTADCFSILQICLHYGGCNMALNGLPVRAWDLKQRKTKHCTFNNGSGFIPQSSNSIINQHSRYLVVY